MTWRVVVISKRAKLELKLNYLLVRDEDVIKIHLSEISILMVENTAVSLTASLLCELVKRKIKVIFCDEKRNPCAELMSYYGSHDCTLKLRSQIAWSDEVKSLVWTEIVKEKIKKQSELLKRNEISEYEKLEEYIKEIHINDLTNREGHAAKVYFNALFGMDFTRTQECVLNSALNYGYGIILSAFNREIAVNGYNTQLGLFHDNMFNQFNLGSDLMEPFRVLIDEEVMNINSSEFTKEEKMQLVNVLNKEVIIEGKRQYVNNAIRIYTKSIFNALNEKDISLMRFYRNEL